MPVEAKKRERDAVFLRAAEQFPEVIERYILDREQRGNEAHRASADNVEEAHRIYHVQLLKLARSLSKDTKFYSLDRDDYSDAHKRLKILKDVIERQDGAEPFYIDGKRITQEEVLQRFMRLIWCARREDEPAEPDEEDPNKAPMVEFKLGSNRKLDAFLEGKLSSRRKREGRPKGVITVILTFTYEDRERVVAMLEAAGLSNHKDILLIDASGGN